MGSGEGRARLMIVTRDRFPPTRVDLTELFSRWLTPHLDIDWVMAAATKGSAKVVAGAPGERFLVSGGGWAGWLWLQLRQGMSVARGQVDLVQVRDAALSAALFRVLARIGRRPFVYWMSYPMVEGYRARAGFGPPLLRLARLAYAGVATALLYRLVLPGAEHVFVQSERMKADVIARGVDAAKITPAPMGVSIALYHPAAIQPTQDERLLGRRVLVYLGAVDAERPIEMLARALGRLAGEGLDVLLVIVGGAATADRRRLETAAARAGAADRLLFTGALPLDEALRYVRRADVCLSPFPVSPTYLSATPTKLVECLAMGRPVVATDHPDQRQVLEESGAGRIAPASAEGFAAAVAALLRDPAHAEAMGAHGPAWVAAHRDYAAISEGVAAVYRRLLEPGR